MNLMTRLAGMLGYERRTGSPSWLGMSSALGAGPPVNERAAENLAAVAACVGAISDALAMAPANIYRRTGSARVEVADHPVGQLIRGGPNVHQTWPDLLQSLMASTLLSGNGLIEIERDGGGAISGLRFVPWSWCSVMLAPSGRLVYDVSEQTGLYGQSGRVRRLLADDVIHLRDRSDDGIIGRSRLSRSAETVASALQVSEFAKRFLHNGALPAGAFTVEGKMGEDQQARLRASMIEVYQGAANAGKPMILEGGTKYEPFSLTPEDTELLGSRRFAAEEIFRLFGVPPAIAGDLSHGTFTNAETAGRWFAQFTLGPWARKVEAVMSRSLFPAGSGLEFELDLSSLLRGDPETRWNTHKIAIDMGILDPDEVREIEGFNPRGTRGFA
ncbi:MAG: phage portal protein [Sandarakinorhabdus sp.]|nr:phage portal protein [Sandarakinorhabdus sp.]